MGCSSSMLTIVFGYCPHSDTHQSCVLTEDGHSLSPTYCRAGGDEEFQLILRTLFQVILRTQDHVQER